MSYIGNSLPANFQSLPAVQRFNGDGSDTTFTLAAQIANDQSILVSVDGVTQDSNAYSVSGTTLTFTAAPSSGTGNIFVHTISPVGSTVVPPDGLAITATTGTFSGDVAINGASATHPLSVNGQIKSTGANGETLQLQTSSQYSGISFIGSDGTRDAIIDYDHTNGALGLKAHTSSHYINFMTGGYSERFRITDNGVTFNGDTAAANALDDYEEGTWTPTLSSGVTNKGDNIGHYTKVGNVVNVMGIGQWTASGTSTAQLTLTLPFIVKNVAVLRGGLSFGMITNSTIISASKIIYAQLDPNIAAIHFRYSNNGASWSAMSPNDMGGTGEIQIGGSYLTD
jgi:hypothetical protein